MLCKERKEVAQLVHRELRFRAARLAWLVAATPAITVAVALALNAASGALWLSRSSLRSFFACGLRCVFLVAHSLFNSRRVLKLRFPLQFASNKAKSLNRPVGVSADGRIEARGQLE
jgi:hypothetical protein